MYSNSAWSTVILKNVCQPPCSQPTCSHHAGTMQAASGTSCLSMQLKGPTFNFEHRTIIRLGLHLRLTSSRRHDGINKWLSASGGFLADQNDSGNALSSFLSSLLFPCSPLFSSLVLLSPHLTRIFSYVVVGTCILM